MPELPAFLADLLEPRFARRARVTSLQDLAPALRRVCFEGEVLKRLRFQPGHEVEVRVGERAFRHYTLSAYDSSRGAIEVLFYLHGQGPGSAWAERLSVDQAVNVLGPGGKPMVLPRGAVLLGDETALGLFKCLADVSGGEVTGAVEVAPGCESWPRLAGLTLSALTRNASRGAVLERWLTEAPGLTTNTHFCLVGHAATVVRLRAALLERGWPRQRIRTKAYWADGKRGL